MNKDKKDKLDKLLAEFIFSCNIPMQTIENGHFKKFVNELCSDYKIPCVKTLKGKLLNNLAAEVDNKVKREVKTLGTIMLDGWKNSANNSKEESFLVKPRKGEVFFLTSTDFTKLKESSENLTNAIVDAMELSLTKYNVEIDSIVTDNAFNMRAAAKNINVISYGCKAHVGNLALIDISDLSVKENVRKIVVNFRKPALAQRILDEGGTALCYASAVRWKGDMLENESLLRNLNIMRKIITSKELNANEVPADVRKLLVDPTFEKRVVDQIAAQKPICEYIDKVQKKDCRLSESCELWFDVKFPDESQKLKRKEFKQKKEHRDSQIFDTSSLIANSFDPRFRGRKLTQEHKGRLNNWIMRNLTLNDQLMYHDFIEKLGKFSPGKLDFEDDPEMFWEHLGFVLPESENLANIALKFLSLPSSTAKIERFFSMWQHVHSKSRNRISKDKSQKLAKIYHDSKKKGNHSRRQSC